MFEYPKTYRRIDCASREEWLENRKGGIGSSEVGALMGESQFDTPMKIWRKHMGLAEPQKETLIMTMGHYLEPLVAEEFAKATDATIDPESAPDWLAVSLDKPYFRVSPDRLFWTTAIDPWDQNEDNALVLECKTTDKYIPTENDYPRYWYWQCQYQMRVMGRDKCALAWITRGSGTYKHTWVQFNPDDWARAEAVLDDFWNRCILGGQMPDALYTTDDAKLRYAKALEGSVTADSYIADCVKELNRLKLQAKDIDNQSEALKLEIMKAMGEADKLTDPQGHIIATWKNGSKGRIFKTVS